MMSHKQTTVETMTALMHDGPLLFCMGLIGMVAGLAIILAGRAGSRGTLPIVVTIVGWIAFLKGLVLMILPSATAVKYFEALQYERFFYMYMSVTLVLGNLSHLRLFSSFQGREIVRIPALVECSMRESSDREPFAPARKCRTSSSVVCEKSSYHSPTPRK